MMALALAPLPPPPLRLLVAALAMATLPAGGWGYLTERRGPRFSVEPPPLLVFSNETGGRADCTAEGSPAPHVEWLVAGDGLAAAPVAGVRLLLANGSLHFPPFREDRFRPDVHSAAYRCAATNAAGRVVSLDMHVRAVVLQPYEARVADVEVPAGNTAVLRCHVPGFARDFVTVTSWLLDRNFNIYPSTEGDAKHVMLPSGELHVLRVDARDARSRYRCRTLDRLTGRTKETALEGRLFVTDAGGSSAPRLVQRSAPLVVVRRGDDVALPCVAHGAPPPQYWWAWQGEGPGEPAPPQPLALGAAGPGERRALLGGSLLVRSAQPEDAGVYVCTANSSAGVASADVQLRVLPDLSAHVVPASLRVDAGAAADFLCITSATQVHWLKDGLRLAGDGGGSAAADSDLTAGARLHIPSVQREDEGMYQCVASLDGEAVQATAELRLGASRPQLLYKFIEQTMQPGPDVSLKCIATGQPTPQMLWSLDGFPLPQGERFVIGQYVTTAGDVISHVNISHVAVEDGGTYECAAVNRMGRASHRAPLRVYGLPLVRKMPPVSAVAGETLVLTCAAAGFPIHTITWEKDGRDLPSNHRQSVSEDGTLTVKNVQKHVDKGSYTCQAHNRQGHSDRGTVEVTVMEPPAIYPFSIESSVHLGERVGLQCIVTRGDAPITITWLKDDAQVEQLQLPQVTVKNLSAFSSTLLVEQLSTQHNGRYTCRARNAAAAAEHSVQLAVNAPPAITPFAFPELAEGARAQATCSVHGGDPPLRFTWLKNGAPLPPHVNVTLFNPYSSILSMSVVRREDSGNYTCVASNPARNSTYSAHLSISVPPEWVVEPRDTSVIAGHSAALHCQASGFPQPRITWRKGHGKQTQHFEQAGAALANGSLLLERASDADEGHYLCEAHNGIGAGLSKVVQLTVNALPRFVVPLSRETVRRGTAATFVCEAVGDAPMSITWLRNGVRLAPDADSRYEVKESASDSSTISQLTVHNTSPADSGKYVCVATNPFGKDETVVQLLVQDVPDAPADVRVEDVASRELKLAWTEPSDGNSPILRYAVAYTSHPERWPDIAAADGGGGGGGGSGAVVSVSPAGGGRAPRPWARVTGLAPATTYYVRVCAVNALGTGPAGAVVSVSTEPEAPSGAPRNVQARPLQPHQLHVTWEPPDPALQNGALLGYYVGVMPASGAGAEGRYNYLTVKADDSSPFVLKDLKSYTQYKITVQAFNSVGAGPFSPDVVATTLESAPSAPPQDVSCSSPTPSSLLVRWEALPAAARNGLILGYIVQFEPLPDVQDDWGEPNLDEDMWSEEGSGGGGGDPPASVRVVGQEASLSPLHKFCNYSVQVSAFTAAGGGPASPALVCRTAEDIPGPPAAVRAALSSPRSALVVWLPPAQPNGVLQRYHVYQREVRVGGGGGGGGAGDEREHEREPVRYSIAASAAEFEVRSLNEHTTYMWWVSVETQVGEGPRSAVVELKPSARVPAVILSFPKTVVVAWKSDVELPCRVVGYPQPSRRWTFRGSPLGEGGAPRVYPLPDGALRIPSVAPSDQGPYECRCENVHSNASVEHRLVVLVPPPPPVLSVVEAGPSNLTVRWATGRPAAGHSLKGFLLAWRKASPQPDPWQEQRLPRRATRFVLGPLLCGTEYELAMAAINQVGRGELGPSLRARTRGGAPQPPAQRLAVSATPRSLLVHLERWRDAHCPISHFTLQRSSDPAPEKHWTTVTDHALPGSSYEISELNPATFYWIRVTAFNNRGPLVTEYKVSTLTINGGIHIPTVRVDSNPGLAEQPVLSDLRVTLPIAASIIVLILTLVTAAACLRRKPVACPNVELPAASDGGSFLNKPDYFSALRKKAEIPPPPPPTCEITGRMPEYVDDIYPYATFQAQKPVPQVSSQRGFQTFVYQGSGLLDVDSYASREDQPSEYAHATAMRSDTDEYDSLGSDSDSRVDDRSTQFHPTSTPSHSNIRHSRLLSMLESSTSTEPSPMPDRRLQAKKGRLKINSPKKKLGFRSSLAGEVLCSGSGGSGSITEETAFSFPSHHKRRDELSEAECDRSPPLHVPVYYRV